MQSEFDERLRELLCANGWQNHHDLVATAIQLRRVAKVVFFGPSGGGAYQLASTLLIDSGSGERIEMAEAQLEVLASLLRDLMDDTPFRLDAWGGKVWVTARVPASELFDIEQLNRTAIGLALFAEHWGDHPFSEENDYMKWLLNDQP